MSNNCRYTCNCAALAVVVSIIIGIIAAFLTFTAVITVTPAFLWVLLGIAVVYLAILLIISSAYYTTTSKCKCQNVSVLLAGILGTILTSIILLGITFAATSVVGAIITGLLIAFFSLIIISVTCLIKSNSRCD